MILINIHHINIHKSHQTHQRSMNPMKDGIFNTAWRGFPPPETHLWPGARKDDDKVPDDLVDNTEVQPAFAR